jgi:hypothetical protein
VLLETVVVKYGSCSEHHAHDRINRIP